MILEQRDFFYALLAALGIYCWKHRGISRKNMSNAAIGANSTRKVYGWKLNCFW